MKTKLSIGVIGGNQIAEEDSLLAFDVGKHIAQNQALLVCGGLGGTMEAVSKGAAEHGGQVIGVLPGDDNKDANQFVSIALPTGMGINRNTLVVRFSDVLIAFPGSFGTLSEIAFALALNKTVIRMPGSWDLAKIGKVNSALLKEAFEAHQAVGLALAAIS